MSTDIEFDCETYDALEDQIKSKPTGLFSKVLPETLYRLFFGSQPLDLDLVVSRREQAFQAYQSLIYKHRSICENLSVALEGGPTDQSSDRELIMDFENISLDSSSFEVSDTTQKNVQRHLRVLETKIDRIEKLCTDIESLLSGDNRVFLRADEQDQLELAQQTLKAYLRKLNIRRKEIRVAQFDQQIDCLEARLETLEARMEPYLSYERYELENGLDRSLNQLQDELASAEQEVDLSILTDDQVNELKRIRQRIQDFSSHLQGYQHEYVDRLFTERVEELKDELLDLQHALTPAKAQGQPIDRESKLRDQIAEIRSKIAELKKYPFQDHLTESRISTLDSLRSRTDDIEAYIDSKVAFDARIDSVESKVSSLQHTASSYLNYEEYLTQPSRSRINQIIETITSNLQTVRREVDLDQLSSPDQERFAELVEAVSEVDDCLDGYNDSFISRERDRYEDLFSDIGSNDLSLTPEQQRAVIRNGIYNQVIAAAGTGKTLTLTTRVAYLIESQEIDPSDILVIAFTKEARDEMEERLSDHFGITDVQIETVHAFGNSIIQSKLGRDINPIGGNQIRNLVDRFIRTARSEDDERFLSHYYQFLVHFDDVYFDEADFEKKEDYVQARVEQRYQTLQGEEVRSRAEKRIADFLFTHQVDYRYEDIATWAETSEEKRSYEPDFYLPEYDIYIEHLGIDLAGEIAPWFSWPTKEYHEKIRWAREQFATAESTLIETYEFEHEAGCLDRSLRARLEHHGVELDRMQFEDLVESAFDYNQRVGWIKRKFADFIQSAKRFDVKPDDIEKQLDPDNPRQYHFGHCGIILLQRYQRFLVENNLIDFSDMITRSLELIQANRDQYRSRYDHVLVDEFQDIGKGKLELIREFVGPASAHLFAVGDDWQSIYSFQGAVVEYFLNFDDHFGTPTRTTLTENFRSPPQIIEAGNALIDTNDEQIEKKVNPTVSHDTTPFVHALQGYTFYDYVHRVSRYATTLVQEYLQQGAEPDDIMILCRFDGAVPYLDEIKSLLRKSGIPYSGKSDSYHGKNGGVDTGVSVYSVYQSKGREAEHVILVHASEGPFGFPPAGRKNELLEPVKRVDGNTVAEERRAFYVAITRSEHTLDILTRNGQESRFLDEIEDFTKVVNQSNSIEPLDDVGSEMAITAKVNHLFDDIHEKKHQEGYLIDQYGESAPFVSWKSNNPPTLVKDEWYRFDGVKVDQFNDQKELVVTHRSSINTHGHKYVKTSGTLISSSAQRAASRSSSSVSNRRLPSD
ncbi:UvrD-helicase domain-containing protein [Natribaculum luteum]|uniref:UvrD-helicase domain-containing protein n=1 Tax=Natribaculum luteum TaxID=1586232 RepID=UPI001FF5919C|nr:UvrD-helicase domain-containing protein [Natribaculum luteum]